MSDEQREAGHVARLFEALEQERPADEPVQIEREALEIEMWRHQPVLSMHDGSIRGCQCSDNVFINEVEDWGSHLADAVIAHLAAAQPVEHGLEVELEAAELQAVIERVKLARSNHPECDVYPDDVPVKCGWKRAVLDIDRALSQGEQEPR